MVKLLSAASLAVLLVSLPAHSAPGGKSDTDIEIRFFQWKVSQDPDDYFNYDRLGVAYIQKARETGDVTYYNLATAALTKSPRSGIRPPRSGRGEETSGDRLLFLPSLWGRTGAGSRCH